MTHRNTILVGDVIERLREVPDGVVQCCVTSPPYWALRQYLFDGAVRIKHDYSPEQREQVIEELKHRGVKHKT